MTPADVQHDAEVRTVEAIVAGDSPFHQVEDYIDALPLGDEQRSALWLLAWVRTTNPATRRRIDDLTVSRGEGHDRSSSP